MVPAFRPPHAPRLLDRLAALEGPLVQVWGWPGSGRTALLDALVESGDARPFRAPGAAPPEEGGSEQEPAQWLIWRDERGDDPVAALDGLRPGQRLVVATRRRLPGPGSVVTPEELLLDESEVAALVEPHVRAPAPSDLSRRLRAATDGWFWPLRLALSGPASSRLAEPTAERLAARPAIATFLRQEVLAPLPPELQELLLELSVGVTLDRDLWQRLWGGDRQRTRGLEELLDGHGLAVSAPGDRPRLPTLLQVLLERERERLWRAAPAAGTPQGRALPSSAVRASAQPAFRVLLFGVPKVTLEGPGGPQEVRWSLRRGFKLFAYLASTPDLRASREELIEAVWGDEGEGAVRRNFHPTLSHLRRSLGAGLARGVATLLFQNGVYRLNPDLDWRIDAAEFEQLANRGLAARGAGDSDGAIAHWEAAWRLYRGPFLEGFYDPWIVERREAFSRTYFEALRRLGDAHFDRQRFDRAMDAYRTVLAMDPLQERVHLAMMRIFARQARRDLVRRQYDLLTELLQEELGVEPLPETTAVYHQLMG